LNYNRFLDDPALNSRIVGMDQYYKDLHDGTLPAVSFMVPSGASEHPPGSIQSGERFVRGLINELMRSSSWKSSAFMWTYDDWGGWYDHVKPPVVDKWGYGFRVPALMVSAWNKKGYVDHDTSDFTSILKFIETNWNLEPLTARDRHANDLMESFDFTMPRPRPAVILGTERHVPRPERPDTAPVYLAYGGAALVTLSLVMLARARTAKLGTHPRALPTDALIGGGERS